MSRNKLSRFVKERMMLMLESMITRWAYTEALRIFGRDLYGWNIFFGGCPSLFEQQNFYLEKKTKCLYINKDFILHASKRDILELFYEAKQSDERKRTNN